jgi:tRNA-dihydrouridine synthase 2
MLRTMANAAKKVPIPKNGVDYRGKVVLAPMVRSGECPSRLLALKYGADLVWGPETIDKALIGTVRREDPVTHTVEFTRVSSNGAKHASLHPDQRESVIYRLHPAREGPKLIYQIGTADPATAVQAAKLIARDVAGIDVNAGCPKPFSTSGGMGAALLKTPDTLCAILRALVTEVGEPFQIGISVKIRILDTADETCALVRRLCETGIHGLTVHCRTTPMRPREPAIRDQLRMVRETCHAAGVSCTMNGDVTGRDEALQLMEEYGVDGAMIATAAEKNPSVFRPASEGGVATWEEVVKEYVKTAMEVDNRWGNTKYLLGQMIPGKQPVYKAMMATKSYSDIVQTLGYSDLEHLAKTVDQRLEIGSFERPRMTKAERKAANKAAGMAAEAGKEKEKEREKEKEANPKDVGSKNETPATTIGVKRTADEAQLEMPPDIARDRGPGSVSGNASTLAV